MRKLLLVCGILSSLLYLAADIASSLRYPGYNYTTQAISELMAVEAPTRSLMIALLVPYGLLVMAFGVGVWLSAGPRRSLHAAGALLIVYGAVGFVGLLASPMHSRGASATMTTTDVMHIVVTGVLLLAMLLFIGFGAAGLGRNFRIYSAVTVFVMFAGGIVAGMQGGNLAAGLPTPGLGITERVNVYSALLWIALFAVALWRQPELVTPVQPGQPLIPQGAA